MRSRNRSGSNFELPRRVMNREEAFREALRAEARREEVAALSTMCGMDLADPAVMAGAWRS